MKTTKRLLGIVLALAMLLTMASFPAFAADEGEAEVGYQYKGKDIVLEASMNGPDKWNSNYSEIRYIARPSTLNLYAGDKLVLPNGGLQLKITPATKKNAAGTTVTPTGFVIDVFRSYGNLDYTDAANLAKVDGKTRFYFAYDASTKTITGIYKTAQEMAEGDPSKALDGIKLDAEGLWGVGMKYAIYHTSTEDVEFISYAAKAYWDFNTNNFKTAPYMFFLDVEAAPTSADYEVSAPAVPAVTAAALTSGTDFKIYARTITANTTTCVISEEKRTNLKNHDSTNRLAGSMMGWELDFDAPAYLETVNISYYPKQFDYAVYGSLDGNNWYQIKGKTASAKNASLSKNFALSVGGVAKYFRIEVVDVRETLWGTLYDTSVLGEVTGALNVLAGNTVTVTGDATGEFTTDANGKLGDDFAAFLATNPAGKEEGKYIYKIDDVDVSDEIADYMFTGNTTVTVEAYVVPEEPQDPNYVYTYTPKTVVFGIKKAAMNATSFASTTNGPIVAPRETIYVSDTMVLPLAAYKNCTLWTSADKGGELTALNLSLWRLGTKDDKDEGSVYDLGKMSDVTFTFTEPGIYSLHTNAVYGVKPDGTSFETTFGTVANAPNGAYNCIIEVKEKPTSAPTTAMAPEYTGEKGEVVTLLTNVLNDTSVAFIKSYGRYRGYNQGGEGKSVVSLEKNLGFPNDEGQVHPISQTQYVQFNLPELSYVTNISFTTNEVIIYDYDAYGSIDDGKTWYLLNSGIVNNKTYTVNGVAQKVRIVVRSTDGWEANKKLLTGYAVKGYTISASDVNKKPAASWVKADGTKTEITSTKALPVAYSAGSKNYAITGWKVETGSGFAKTSLVDIANNNLGNVYAIVEEIPFAATALTGALVPAGADVGKEFDANEYINGFYLEGAQIRVPEGEGAAKVDGGLRFVNILDNALITELDELRSSGEVVSYQYGTLAMASTKYTGGDLVIGYSKYCKEVPGERIFASADDFDNEYFKYTVCVTNIAEENYTKDVMVRPYITITKADGSVITLYGEQYQASVYGAADFALTYKRDTLTDAEIAHLESIVAAVNN